MKRPFLLVSEATRQRLIDHIHELPLGSSILTNTEPTRTLEQNAAQWPILQAFSNQLLWPVNGELCKLSPDEWKEVLTCAFDNEQNPRLAQGFDGGVVMLGHRTRYFAKQQFSEWLSFLNACADIKKIRM